MRKSLWLTLALLALGSGVLTGCGGTSMVVTRYPGFWNEPGEFNGITIAPIQNEVYPGEYTGQVATELLSKTVNSQWYNVYNYTNNYMDYYHLRPNERELIVFPTIIQYDNSYDVSIYEHSEQQRLDFDDGTSQYLHYTAYSSETTYTGVARLRLDFMSSKRGDNSIFYTVTKRGSCSETESYNPPLPPHAIHVPGGPLPGDKPDTVRPPRQLPPPPRVPSEEEVRIQSYRHADYVSGGKEHLLACAVRDVAREAAYELVPYRTTITIYEDEVFKFYQANKNVSTISSQINDFTVVFNLPSEATFNVFTVDVIGQDEGSVPIQSDTIKWDKDVGAYSIYLKATDLYEASGGQTKFAVRLIKDGVFVLQRKFSVK